MFLTFLLFFVLGFSIQAKEIKLTTDNTAVLRESFNASSITQLKQDLSRLDANLKSGYPIYLVLYTPGGSVQKGLELFEFAKGLNRPIHTVTIFAASMGFQAIQNLGKRYVLKYGILMSHKARGGFEGEFGGGLGQLDARYSMWLKRVDSLDKQTVKRTKGKQTLKSYRAAYENELWLNGDEAVAKGYADEVAIVSCSKDLSQGKSAKTLNLGFFKVKLQFSDCPLVTSPLGMSASILTNNGYMDMDDFLVKNGKFGKDCKRKKTKQYDSFSSENIVEEKELCAYDINLSYEKIKAQMEKQMSIANKDLRNSVKYSY